MSTRLPITALTGTLLFGCSAGPTQETGFHTGFSCFVRGTKVSTPKGMRAIEDLEVGDLVWSWNTETHTPVARRIKECIVGESKHLFQINAEEQVIQGVTAEHPFWVPTVSAWLTAGSLTTGQELLSWLGQHESKSIPITMLQSQALKEPVPVFTLSIDGPEHNFFAEGILVHNKSPRPNCWQTEQSTTMVDFDTVPVHTTAQKTYILKVFSHDECFWLEESERTLSLRLDDPSGVFTLTSTPLDMIELQGEEIQYPITFTPNEERAFEAQLLFNITRPTTAFQVPPKSIQLFGKGEVP